MARPVYELRTCTQRLVDVLLHFHHRRIDAILRTLARSFDGPRSIVVEIGAGTKSETRFFSKALYISTDLVPRKGIDLVQTATNLTFHDDTVDLVVSKNLLEHIFEPQQALDEMHRILRPKGCLFLVTPFFFPLHDPPYDFFRYTEYSLRYLLRRYSKILMHKIMWLPAPERVFERFVLYYVCVGEK